MKVVDLEVVGDPAPQGSKRAIVNKFTHKPALVESSKKVAPWRQDVKAAALAKFETPLTGPVEVTILFRFLRPVAHLNVKREVKPSAPVHKITKPDIDKLVRSTLDGLKGAAYLDDSQVVMLVAAKEFATRPGAIIQVREPAIAEVPRGT